MAIVGHTQSDKWETFDLLRRKQFSYWLIEHLYFVIPDKVR